MAHSSYAQWSRGRMLDDDRAWPGPQGMMLRFGSWRKVMARAGMPANPRGGPSPRFELNDAVDAVVQAWRDTGKPPTVAGYDAWRGGRDDVPGSATARKLVDSWDSLRLAAWPLVHERALPDMRAPDPSGEREEEVGVDPGAPGQSYRRAPEDSRLVARRTRRAALGNPRSR